MLTPLLLPFGLFAGALTTVAGLGGGQLLVLALAALWDPRTALVVSAPALLAGNTHRLWLYRNRLDLRVGGAFATGALPGSILGGIVAVGLPQAVIHGLILTATAAAISRALGLWSWTPKRRALLPMGFVIGTVCATSSSAGLLVAPLLLATGLAGETYVATSALCAASMHIGRLSGYGLGGALTWPLLGTSLVLALCIVAGNLLGDRLRRRLAPRAGRWIEHGVLVACVALALVGLG
jgi:hypothetical protein